MTYTCKIFCVGRGGEEIKTKKKWEATHISKEFVPDCLVWCILLVFFWAAFEQAGNVLNVWADQSTDRFITEAARPPSVIPEVIEAKVISRSEVPADFHPGAA